MAKMTSISVGPRPNILGYHHEESSSSTAPPGPVWTGSLTFRWVIIEKPAAQRRRSGDAIDIVVTRERRVALTGRIDCPSLTS